MDIVIGAALVAGGLGVLWAVWRSHVGFWQELPRHGRQAQHHEHNRQRHQPDDDGVEV